MEHSIVYRIKQEKKEKQDKDDCEKAKIILQDPPIGQGQEKDRKNNKKNFCPGR